MSSVTPKDIPQVFGRRISPRLRLSLRCEVIHADGRFRGLLMDLSRTGARIALMTPPPLGSGVALRWDGYEAACRVRWVHERQCGLDFDEGLADEVVVRTRALPDRQSPAERAACQFLADQLLSAKRPTVRL